MPTLLKVLFLKLLHGSSLWCCLQYHSSKLSFWASFVRFQVDMRDKSSFNMICSATKGFLWLCFGAFALIWCFVSDILYFNVYLDDGLMVFVGGIKPLLVVCI